MQANAATQLIGGDHREDAHKPFAASKQRGRHKTIGGKSIAGAQDSKGALEQESVNTFRLSWAQTDVVAAIYLLITGVCVANVR